MLWVKGKRIAIGLLIAIFVAQIVVFSAMWISTAQVMRDVKDVVYGRVEHEQIAGTELEFFDVTKHHPDAKVSLSMERLFVLCGTQRGCMWVHYSYEGRDKDGELETGSWGIVSHWDIERINGHWEITHISEKP